MRRKFGMKVVLAIVLFFSMMGCKKDLLQDDTPATVQTECSLEEQQHIDGVIDSLISSAEEEVDEDESKSALNPPTKVCSFENYKTFTSTVTYTQKYSQSFDLSLFIRENVIKATLLPTTGDVDLYITYTKNNIVYSFKQSTNGPGINEVLEFYIADFPTGTTKFQVTAYGRYAGSSSFTMKVDKNYSEKVLLNLTTFKYVYQNYVPTAWNKDASYSISNCALPSYIGVNTFITSNTTNLCGIASLLNASSLVTHDAVLNIPDNNADKAKLLARIARMYKTFYPSYVYGDGTRVDYLSSMMNGTTTKKGLFTNWSNCAILQNLNGSAQVSYTNTTDGRNSTKVLILSALRAGYPVVVPVCVYTATSAGRTPSSSDYFDGPGAHIISIVGLEVNYKTNEYYVYFKDPLYNDSQTYKNNYTKLLNGMVRSPLQNYNTIVIKGL